MCASFLKVLVQPVDQPGVGARALGRITGAVPATVSSFISRSMPGSAMSKSPRAGAPEASIALG
jgi:hypothetical protein